MVRWLIEEQDIRWIRKKSGQLESAKLSKTELLDFLIFITGVEEPESRKRHRVGSFWANDLAICLPCRDHPVCLNAAGDFLMQMANYTARPDG